MVFAGEQHLNASVERLGMLEHLVKERTLPGRSGDGVVAPGFASGQRSHREAPVSGALEGDDPLDSAHRLQFVERERVGLFDRAADLESAIVVGNGEVAADVVQQRWGDVGFECFRWRLSVERLGVDHRQCRTFVFQIVC